MQITALVGEFLVPGVLILLSAVAGIDFIVAGAIRQKFVSRLLIVQLVHSGGGASIAVNTAAWAGLGFIALSLSYALGLVTNFLMFLWVQRPLQRRLAGIALERLGVDVVARESKFLAESDENVERWLRALDEGKGWRGLHGAKRKLQKRQSGEAAEALFSRIFDYVCVRDPAIKGAADEYISLERICRGYGLAFILIAIALVLQWFVLQAGLGTRENVVFGLCFAVTVGLAISSWALLRYAILMEYAVRGRVLLGMKARDREEAGQVKDEGSGTEDRSKSLSVIIGEILRRWAR